MSEVKKEFWTWLKTLPKRWFVDGLSSMAFGLFASLLIGTIISQIGRIGFLSFLKEFGDFAQSKQVVGAAIGVAVAYGMKYKPLVIFSCAAVGGFGYVCGGPMGAYVAALFAAEVGNLVSGKTRIDILLVPFVAVLVGCVIGKFVGPPISAFMQFLGNTINSATALRPFPMGIIVSVITGMVLTAPISSAAICMSMGISGLAAGAATVGCCVNMVGFAVISYNDNKIGGSLAQGLGTSMLQVPNIIKKPVIWLPAIIASAILGPVATLVLPMYNNAVGAGMGTSGLVGPINTYIVMTSEEIMQGFGATAVSPIVAILEILLMFILLPGLVTYGIYWLMHRWGWIKDGYMKIETK